MTIEPIYHDLPLASIMCMHDLAIPVSHTVRRAAIILVLLSTFGLKLESPPQSFQLAWGVASRISLERALPASDLHTILPGTTLSPASRSGDGHRVFSRPWLSGGRLESNRLFCSQYCATTFPNPGHGAIPNALTPRMVYQRLIAAHVP